jgi:hypothetical protein
MTSGSTNSSTMHLPREYAYVGLRDRPGSLPLAELVGWAGLPLDPVFLPASLILIVLLFPTGSCRRQGGAGSDRGPRGLLGCRVYLRASVRRVARAFR